MATAAQRPTSPMDVDGPPATQDSTPGAFPTTNGVNGDQENNAPPPPAHKPQPNGTPSSTAASDAVSFKDAGNKFFKAKQYDKAIAEYTKGKSHRSREQLQKSS